MDWLINCFRPSKIAKSLPQTNPTKLLIDEFDKKISARFEDIERSLSSFDGILQGLNKSLRRIHLGTDQNSQILKDIHVQNREVLKIDGGKVAHFELDKSDILKWLDALESDASSTSETRARDLILSTLKWRAVAQIGSSYHPIENEILEAVASEETPGSILQIIQNGYKDSQGTVIRKAKVLVAKAHPQP